MDIYKNNLILEMTTLRDRILQNRSLVFFLLRNDFIFSEISWGLIKSLHEWPYQLTELVDEAEDRHKNDRNLIEAQLIQRKDVFEKEVAEYHDNIKEMSFWGDLYGYR
jgi:hypothetical protein